MCYLLQIITPFRRLILCAENRKEMEDWISSLKSVQSREHYEVSWYPSWCNLFWLNRSNRIRNWSNVKSMSNVRVKFLLKNFTKWELIITLGFRILEGEQAKYPLENPFGEHFTVIPCNMEPCVMSVTVAVFCTCKFVLTSPLLDRTV